MSRWFRFYEESLNDPKLLRLSDGLYRAWTILLCFASKNDGILPPVEDMAAALRTKPAKVSGWIKELSAGGLIDEVDGRYEPHNWHGRQYKSDVSTERVKRFRNGKRNVSETPPETDTETEQKKDAAPSGAQVVPLPPNPEKIFFDQAVQFLGPDARSLAAKLLKAKNGNVLAAHQALLTAVQKSNPREYLGAIIRGRESVEDLRARGEAW